MLILTHGRIVKEALKAQRMLQDEGIHVGILLLEQLKPYDQTAQLVLPYLPERAAHLLFLEEEIRAGGMGMLLEDALVGHKEMANKTTSAMALMDSFGEQTADEPILRSVGLDAESIVAHLKSNIG